jgi:hydroxymethylbilane synthase
MSRPLRLGTRGSRLARIQAEIVAGLLRGSGLEVELVPIVTTGDRRSAGGGMQEIADDGWFTRALREALETGSIDLAVHSAKDLPIEAEPRTAFAFLERADPRDALLTRERVPLSGLPSGSTVGTDSVRRAGFLGAVRPDLRFVPLRGNVPTRIEKLERGEADAVVLAVAGLDRLGLGDRIDEVLEPEVMPPAPAQGALAVEVQDVRSGVGQAVSRLDDALVGTAVRVERAVLKSMGGGCRSPLGALVRVVEGELTLVAGVPGTILHRSAPRTDQDRLVAEVTKSLIEVSKEETWQPR